MYIHDEILRKKKTIDVIKNTNELYLRGSYNFPAILLSRKDGIVKNIITALSEAGPTPTAIKHRYLSIGRTIILDAVPITNAFSIDEVLPMWIDPPVIINTETYIKSMATDYDKKCRF
jgi:hypothetical protein